MLNSTHKSRGEAPRAGPSPATKEATEIRKLLCDAADAKLFNVVLTPNYNKPHQNHFHLEVTRGVTAGDNFVIAAGDIDITLTPVAA